MWTLFETLNLKEESMALLMNQSDLPLSRRMYGHNLKNKNASEIEESWIWFFFIDWSLFNLVKWEQNKRKKLSKNLNLIGEKKRGNGNFC